ncbi:MAG: hypothetical protein Q7R49_03660 [Candidatus Daviesbacteria bacterium]|nr:hypothetical protein [Candidatus Daviesbacteria bacterium]
MTKGFAEKYEKKNPTKARIIKRAVKRGVKEYAETFKRLANT